MQVGNDCRTGAGRPHRLSHAFDDPAQPPPQSVLYFRGPVLSALTAANGWPSRCVRTSRRAARAALPAQPAGARPCAALRSHAGAQQAPLADGAGIHGRAPSCPATRTYMTQDLQWMTTRPITDLQRYRAESHPEFRHGPTASVRSCAPSPICLPPGFNPRTLALAANACRPAWRATTQPPWSKPPWQRLRTGGYTYTLEPGCTASTRPTSSGSTASRAFASTLPRPSWC
jgi:hypothetical protein